VELDGGEIIVIERFVKFRESMAITGSAYSSTSSESSLTFVGELANLSAWKYTLVPLVLYRDASNQEWVIVASNYSCDEWDVHGKPRPPYWEYRLQGGQWTQSKLSAASIGRKTNLFFDYEPEQPARHISLRAKAETLKNNTFAKRYLSVLADAKSKCG
jgi:hypothetical protein